jgi:NAD(P)-dependent dehydrogenase (short-subunit alcohol dehydrogenase family)
VARRVERLEELAKEIGGLPLAGDLVEADEAERVVATTAAELGPPEILVNVAGILHGVHPAATEPLSAIDATLALNLVAPYRLSQLVFPHMCEVGRGAIVNVSSISGVVGIPGIPQGSYAASKRGLSGLAAELAVQWAPQSVRVNTLATGFFKSEMTAAMYEDERSLTWLRRNTPLPYDGEPADFVGAVLWLTSDAGRYVTGQTIVVDGGWTAR